MRCTLCIFPKIYHHLPNELNAECLQNSKILHFKCIMEIIQHFQFEISIATHSILTMNRRVEHSHFSLFSCINLMKFAAFVRKTVVCHIQWMLKMKEPNKIRYFIEFYSGYWVIFTVQCTTLQQTYYNVHFSTGSRWC